MTETSRRARVVHAIPGRLRIRFEDAGMASTDDGLAGVRVAPGILAIELKPASRSFVVQYDPTTTTRALVLAEIERAGISVATEAAPHPPARGESPASGSGGAQGARDARGRFVRQAQVDEPAAEEGAEESKAGGRSELWEMLIGPPLKFDRRLAESLTLSAISLMAARRVGLALGGGTTLPAYFVIWFALRRMTGLGRRR